MRAAADAHCARGDPRKAAWHLHAPWRSAKSSSIPALRKSICRRLCRTHAGVRLEDDDAVGYTGRCKSSMRAAADAHARGDQLAHAVAIREKQRMIPEMRVSRN